MKKHLLTAAAILAVSATGLAKEINGTADCHLQPAHTAPKDFITSATAIFTEALAVGVTKDDVSTVLSHLDKTLGRTNFALSMLEVSKDALAEGASAEAVKRVIDSLRLENSMTTYKIKSDGSRATDNDGNLRSPINIITSRDRNQSVFQTPFVEAYNKRISSGTISRAKQKMKEHANLFQEIESRFGVPKEVLATFWGLETNFGSFQGDIHTVSALAILAHDCRRPHIFKPQLAAVMKLATQNNFDLYKTSGAWAGEVGSVQMLPNDILHLGLDGDGDGQVSLKTSTADAMMSAANMLAHHGWKTGEPWIKEVRVSQNSAFLESGLSRQLSVAQWKSLGLSATHGSLGNNSLIASLVSPQGHNGPKFLV